MPTPLSLPKGYLRLGDFPLDDSSVFETYSGLQSYAANNGTAYPGQVCSVRETGSVYVIQNDKSLLEVGASSGGIVSDTPPPSPADGTRWINSATGRSFDFFGGFWVETGGGALFTKDGVSTGSVAVVSDNPPSAVSDGMRWINSATGRSFDFFGGFWVETGGGGGGGGNANVQYVTELPANPSPTTFYVVTPVGGTSTIYLGNISLGGGSGGGGGSTFTPTSIVGLQLWLDADDSTTLFDATSGGSAVSADGSVARWEDKSGNGTHVTQSTVNARPLLKTFQKNGRSGIYFDGNDFLAKPKQLFTTTVTIFAVAKFSNNNERLAILDLGSSTGYSYATIEQNTYNTSGGKYGFYWSSSSNDTNIPTDSFEKIFSVSVNSLYGTNIASSTLYRINGVSASITRTGGRIDHQDYTAVSGFVIGGFNTGQNGSPFSNGAELLKGTIYEILVYNSYLSSSDRQQVESYLSTKWGISI